MKHHIVIDTSVYITYATYGKLYRIVNAVELFNLALFIDDHLLKEFEKNLKRLSLKKQIDVEEGMILLKMMSIKMVTIPIFTSSPDPKDNFLFDLAFQTNSEVIVTKEKILLDFKESPVTIQDIKWFKETYPVAL